MFYIIDKVLNLKKSTKIIIVILNDIFLFYFSIVIAIYLSDYTITFQSLENNTLFILPLGFFIPIFYFSGLYSSLFRFVDISIIRNCFIAVFIYLIFFYSISFFGILQNYIVNNAIIIHSLIFFILISSSRLFFARVYIYFNSLRKKQNIAFVYGAGNSGRAIDLYLPNFKILGFIDDDENKINKKLNGINIYSLEKGQIKIQEKKVTDLFVAISNLSQYKKDNIIKSFSHLNINIKFIPNLIDIINYSVKTKNNNYVNAKDLVTQKINWDFENINILLRNKCVLVSGAGGSIGTEIVRQIINFYPNKIILIDNSEYNLYNLQNKIYSISKEKKLDIQFYYKLEDITNIKSLNSIFEKYKPNFIFHAAAYKHVNLSSNNFIPFINNNIFGTLNIVKCSEKYNAENFTLISTDKAVNPINVMGYTKRFSELIVLGYSNKKNQKVKFSVVRFGNVLDSNGSVVPLFRKQIDEGGPVTVTHPEVNRYFMLIPDAVGLVLISMSQSVGGEVYVLDMGKPIKILDIAKNMITLSGLNLKDKKNNIEGIEIIFTGLKEGEKISEKLYTEDSYKKTQNPNIHQSNEKFVEFVVIDKLINQLKEYLDEEDESSILKYLIYITKN